MLGRKLDSGIFEEVVAEEKELTHDRGEDEFSGFAGGADAWPRESVPNFGQRARAVATVSAPTPGTATSRAAWAAPTSARWSWPVDSHTT